MYQVKHMPLVLRNSEVVTSPARDRLQVPARLYPPFQLAIALLEQLQPSFSVLLVVHLRVSVSYGNKVSNTVI